MSRRAALLRDCLREWLPEVPEWEAGEIVAHCRASGSTLRRLPPGRAVRLAAVAFVRHTFTDYEDLLEQGWGIEAARHVVAPAIEAVLAAWGARGPILGGHEGDGTPPADVE